MQTTTDNIIGKTYGISLPNMIDRIVWAMEDAFYPETDAPPHIRLLVIEFMNEQGDNAVVALFGFIRYIQLSGKSEEEKTRSLKETISHDINGRNDKTMLPRSSAYTEFAHR